MPAATISRQTAWGAPPAWGHPVPVAYGAAQDPQVAQLMSQYGYSEAEAKEILGLNVGAGRVGVRGRNVDWSNIIGGITDAGTAVASGVMSTLQQTRSNQGYDVMAQQATAQQQILDQQRLLMLQQQQQSRGGASTGTVLLAVGGLTIAGLLVALVVTRPKKKTARRSRK